MCGIFGHYAPGGASIALVERMARLLAHRGPDGYGLHADPDGRFAFGAGRLAIIDLSAHPGILFSEDRQTAVAFNGEIYNYKPLRAALERAGHQFATHTDTEVIVHGYEQWGDGVIERLRGMFGVAVWDSTRQRVLIARDRLGEKPLYYAPIDGDAGREWVFASEVKALFAHPGLRRAVDPDGLIQFLSLGYTLPPRTAFAGVCKLAPGAMLICENGGVRTVQYWLPHPAKGDLPPYPDAVRQVRALLEETVAMQMMSDVPIGAFLSGGVDSTAVVALMRRALAPGQTLSTFTVGFDVPPEGKADRKFNVDARYAAAAAAHFGTQHHAIYLKQDERLSDLLPHLIYHQDDLIAMPTVVQTAYVAALARTGGVPVLLNGEAGDELFMGYQHYRTDQVLTRYLRLPALLRRGVLDSALARLPGGRFDSARKLPGKAALGPAGRYLTWTRILDFEQIARLLHAGGRADAQAAVHAWIDPLLAVPGTDDFTERLAVGNLIGFVGENSNMRVDKMCMAMSVEARSPLEDYRLAELALRLPRAYKLRGGDFKAVFKDAIRDLVPQNVLTRPKWGFNPPASDWLRGPLQPLIRRWLSREYIESVGVFDAAAVERALHEHVVEREYRLWEVWTALAFHVWHALFIDQALTLPEPLAAPDLVAGAVVHPPKAAHP
ncbi:MAG: asparagine synthase (glutamine-hydrolyzing) [bacterium]|nr:asparagine synthase (glutamine-hydrolyzing) [bacterium]